MKDFGVFDIVGPIMIGPSSSHTAGAARLAKVASIIAGGKIKKVQFLLHGSFAKTYKGHGTDKALVAGILRMDPWDENLKDSFLIAEKEGIEVVFIETDLGDVHPNTVKFIITKDDGQSSEVSGSSIGGGNIVIFDIEGQEVEFTGEYPTLLTQHRDMPGVISKITSILYEEKMNIANMRVYRNSRGKQATMALETDSLISHEIIDKIKVIPEIENVKFINPIVEGDI
ncbi:L-serine dehydratase [Clostridium tetanomorphum]|uniref:L-serine deaminase n=1 Tax=Clostridium tetanomorphum TaxID=1553 RepID=A0A923E8T4_CLOTT|nr:L-serine ammonia-lyase, iron-sulfur-dependent subunit beta [Clostridium tetanomorphum]KAJ49477.1 L-serine dehydratase, iron-sulfur-dependent subunit beta [Clostridium tetanomorphum DSM 665]KAJ51446.1 L-serine dehydratase, iron-sulfur-dependent subunit beta [Clostridium tetanomorphum DSM 665]MBC2396539.1 L-serine ammonia-lyase, iron-sulfur-dependent, subunit beta [Clostridium tetanomorphum]MBP1863865.1 L-serine dehydratase [Clostridium tetanomorphum]NRS84943.1 L-serine dehydratase [Clostridi